MTVRVGTPEWESYCARVDALYRRGLSEDLWADLQCARDPELLTLVERQLDVRDAQHPERAAIVREACKPRA